MMVEQHHSSSLPQPADTDLLDISDLVRKLLYVKGDDRFYTVPAANELDLQREIIFVRDYIVLFMRLMISRGVNRSGQYTDPYVKWWERGFPTAFPKVKAMFKDRDKLKFVTKIMDNAEEGTLAAYQGRNSANDKKYHKHAEKLAEESGVADLEDENGGDSLFLADAFREPEELLPGTRFETRMMRTVRVYGSSL